MLYLLCQWRFPVQRFIHFHPHHYQWSSSELPDAAETGEGSQCDGGDEDERGGEGRLLDVGLARELGEDVGDVAAEDLTRRGLFKICDVESFYSHEVCALA